MISRIRGFWLFLVDFLVGDAPELGFGAVIILGIAFAIHQATIAAAAVVPASVIALMGVSLWRGTNR
jgi:hypothetical protein